MSVLDHIKAGAKRASPEKAKKPDASNPAPNVARDALGRLLPGQVLNPGGRPKGVESSFKAILERSNAEQLFEQVISGEIHADIRLRIETARWVHERAFGKALERAQNVNVTLAGGAEPLDLAKLDMSDIDALSRVCVKGAPQLPAGDVVDAEFKSDDLPSTDIAADAEQKNKP